MNNTACSLKLVKVACGKPIIIIGITDCTVHDELSAKSVVNTGGEFYSIFEDEKLLKLRSTFFFVISYENVTIVLKSI